MSMPIKDMYKLKINKQLKKFISPLSNKERNLLESNIIRDGCREPLCVWKNTILDGHNRYEICTRLNIPFSIQRIKLSSIEEAIVWVCDNQLGRRNITNETRKYLIGKRYEMEKIIGAHNIQGVNQYSKKEVRNKILTQPPRFEDTVYRTRNKIGKEYNISQGSVYRYGVYANAMDSLSKISPELVEKILSGKVKITYDNILELTKLPDKTIKKISKTLQVEGFELNGSIRKCVIQEQKDLNKYAVSLPSVAIKEMPTYDPNAEITALAFTIPSWVSSIRRTHSVANLNKSTDDACSKLKCELVSLKEAVDIMLAAINEVK